MNHSILIVDYKESARVLTKDYLGKSFDLFEAGTKEECIRILRTTSIEAIILDLHMPGVKGFELLTQIKQKYPNLPIVILTSFGDFQKAVQATKLGAFDFIPKEQAELLLKPSLDKIFKAQETSTLRDAFKGALKTSIEYFIPDHSKYADLYLEAERLAKSDLSFFLSGETGTGKDVLAQYIHNKSGRTGAFVRVDCGELDSHFLKSELFGHEKGAYTGAEFARIGKIELAHGGTLFLDEIGNMSLDIQARFLTVLEQKYFERLGGNKAISVDFRIVSATNVDLKKAVEAGKFREDLFYRINELELRLPSIRESIDVLPQFTRHFLDIMNKNHNSNFSLSDSVLADYLSYHWPGNIRELKARLKRDFFKNQFKADGIEPSEKKDISTAIEVIEKINIEKAMALHNGNISKAAHHLNLKRQTLTYKLKKYGLKLESDNPVN